MKKQLLFVFAVLGAQNVQASCVATALLLGDNGVQTIPTVADLPNQTMAHITTGQTYIIRCCEGQRVEAYNKSGDELVSSDDVSVRCKGCKSERKNDGTCGHKRNAHCTVKFMTAGQYVMKQGKHQQRVMVKCTEAEKA